MIPIDYITEWSNQMPWKTNEQHAEGQPPGRKQFLQNIENKMLEPEFLGDTSGLLRQGETYNPNEAFELVKSQLILKT